MVQDLSLSWASLQGTWLCRTLPLSQPLWSYTRQLKNMWCFRYNPWKISQPWTRPVPLKMWILSPSCVRLGWGQLPRSPASWHHSFPETQPKQALFLTSSGYSQAQQQTSWLSPCWLLIPFSVYLQELCAPRYGPQDLGLGTESRCSRGSSLLWHRHVWCVLLIWSWDRRTSGCRWQPPGSSYCCHQHFTAPRTAASLESSNRWCSTSFLLEAWCQSKGAFLQQLGNLSHSCRLYVPPLPWDSRHRSVLQEGRGGKEGWGAAWWGKSNSKVEVGKSLWANHFALYHTLTCLFITTFG